MADVDFTTLNAVANVLTVAVLLLGLLFGVVQLNHLQRRRRDAIALEAVRIMQDEATAKAVQCVLGLPDSVSQDQLVVRGPDVESCVSLVEYNFDTLGWMVHRRMIPLRDLDDLMGGAVRAVWRRVHVLAEERRHVTGQSNHFEWTQWLAEQLEAHPSPAKQSGAHIYYRRWRP
ncbi:MAG: hypothetical protein ABR562_08045 [Thermoplasmatota archaeon]